MTIASQNLEHNIIISFLSHDTIFFIQGYLKINFKMPLTKKEVDELQPIIKETVTKRLGFPENAVIKAAVACLQEELDHDMATEKMSSLLGDDLASRFVEDLLNAAHKFRLKSNFI